MRLAAQMLSSLPKCTRNLSQVQVPSAGKVCNWDTYFCFCPVTRDSSGSPWSEAPPKGPQEETSCELQLSLKVSIFFVSAPCTKSEVDRSWAKV